MKFIFYFFIFLNTLHAYAEGRTKPFSEAELKRFQVCKKDTDCVYVQNGSCDCANGGESSWINKRYKEKFIAEFKQDTICTLRAAVPSCDTGTPKCFSNLCTREKKKNNK